MISLDWGNESKTLLKIEVDTTWTWTEYNDTLAKILAMLRETEESVILLVDARKVLYVPDDAFNHMSRGNKALPLNLKAQVIVSENRWLEAIVAILNYLIPEESERFVFVRTMEKAEKRIAIIRKPPKRRRRRVRQQSV